MQAKRSRRAGCGSGRGRTAGSDVETSPCQTFACAWATWWRWQQASDCTKERIFPSSEQSG
eukprot:3633648-Rhodomonas_salina.2